MRTLGCKWQKHNSFWLKHKKEFIVFVMASIDSRHGCIHEICLFPSLFCVDFILCQALSLWWQGGDSSSYPLVFPVKKTKLLFPE